MLCLSASDCARLSCELGSILLLGLLVNWHNLLFLSFTLSSISSIHGLVVWGWGLRIDSVLTLFQPCTADPFYITIIIIIIIIKEYVYLVKKSDMTLRSNSTKVVGKSCDVITPSLSEYGVESLGVTLEMVGKMSHDLDG